MLRTVLLFISAYNISCVFAIQSDFQQGHVVDYTATNNNKITSHLPTIINDNNEDTLLKFSMDIKHVLHDLRAAENDPNIPSHLLGTNTCLSYSKTWTLDDWEYHNSRKRYYRYLKSIPTSRLIKRIWPQQCTLLVWTLLSIWIEGNILPFKPSVPLSALSSISTFVAFLLTLRSNSSLARLIEARNHWSKVVLNTREMANMIMVFIYPIDKQLALILGRHVSLFGWLLRSDLQFVRADKDRADKVELVRTMLPNRQDADYVLSQRQPPVAIITRIRQVLAHLGKTHRLSTAEEIAIEHIVHALSDSVTKTGTLRAAPIPTLYTSHTSRLLVFYLSCLPTALKLSGLDTITTTILTMVIGFAMIGLDEISHLFEQPFRVIPMYQMSKRSTLAVADAFTCQPPSLVGEIIHDDEVSTLTQRELTSYWSSDDINKVSDNLME